MNSSHLFSAIVFALALQLPLVPAEPPPAITRVPVVFAEGHQTDPRDKGRPVVLIAAALSVPPDVFREAFSHVHPAAAGSRPEPEQVRENKAALMAALAKYGVTNDQLDRVSDYYRYPPGRGGLWTSKPAVANALVQNGVVTGYEIVSGGSGYSSPPTVTIPGVKAASVKVELSFGKLLEMNGAVTGITPIPDEG